jgi:hypothetical protein
VTIFFFGLQIRLLIAGHSSGSEDGENHGGMILKFSFQLRRESDKGHWLYTTSNENSKALAGYS